MSHFSPTSTLHTYTPRNKISEKSAADVVRKRLFPVGIDSRSVEDWPSRYTPLKVLGNGHDGVCYLCTDNEHERDDATERVAIKILKPKRGRKITEPEMMKDLLHDNIVRMRRVHSLANSVMCMVLDYCDQSDLCDHVSDHKFLSEPATRTIMRQLHAGLMYLHGRRICHRDLKLDNVFLTHDMCVKIGDFGAACHFDPLTKLTYRCGTTQYMAPELLREVGYYGDRVDCWALGVMLYVMLIGKFPLDGKGDMRMLWQITTDIKFPPSIVLSSEVLSLIHALLTSDEQQRATLDFVSQHRWMRIIEEDNDGHVNIDSRDCKCDDDDVSNVPETTDLYTILHRQRDVQCTAQISTAVVVHRRVTGRDVADASPTLTVKAAPVPRYGVTARRTARNASATDTVA
jgi:serine/threonine protein kinase